MLFKSLFTAVVTAVAAMSLFSMSSFANDEVSGTDVLPYLITTGDPDDPKFGNTPENPAFKNGVGSIFIEFTSTTPGGFICTASAISPTHILTAGHCLRNGADTITRVRFILPNNGGILEGTGFSVNPLFDELEPFVGAFAPGDVAVIELSEPVPTGVDIYDLYRETEELGLPTQHYGHGRSGVGGTGATGDADFFYGRTGQNQYDELFAPLIGSPLFEQLIHDFDSGTAANDAAPWWYSPAFLCPTSLENGVGNAGKCNVARGQGGQYRDKGFGEFEVGIAPGDSGGPGFIDGKIAGVHSFGFTYFCGFYTASAPDATCGLDSSYGEMAGDARVSANADWIDAQVADGVSTPIPEPQATGSASTSVGDSASLEITAQGRYFMSQATARHLRLEVKTAPTN